MDLTFDGLMTLLTGYNQLIREKQKPLLYHHVILSMTELLLSWWVSVQGTLGLHLLWPASSVAAFTVFLSGHYPPSDERKMLLSKAHRSSISFSAFLPQKTEFMERM